MDGSWIGSLVYFGIGVLLLVKGADYFVEGARGLAERLQVSKAFVGFTIISLGTSIPEFVVNMNAFLFGIPDIATGNIFGSNIANILLILGISATIYPLVAKRATVLKEIPFSLLAALLVGITANDVFLDGASSSMISRVDGLLFIAFFIIFLYYTFGIARVGNEDIGNAGDIKHYGYGKSILFIILGLIGLVIGGKWIVDGAIIAAEALHVSQSLIGLTVVAIGTSLPELATSAVAAYKKHADIAIGNVVGSNIFNVFWILGFSAVLRPLPFQPASNIDVAVAVIASLILFVSMYIGKRHILERWQGACMIMMYVAYIGFLIASQSWRA